MNNSERTETLAKIRDMKEQAEALVESIMLADRLRGSGVVAIDLAAAEIAVSHLKIGFLTLGRALFYTGK